MAARNNNEIGREMRVDITQVIPDPDQPRKEFDLEKLKVFARGLKEHGQKQAVIVTPLFLRVKGHRARWKIVDGERRYRALRLLKSETILIIVRADHYGAARHKRHLDQIILNFNREDHTFMELSNAFATQTKAGTSVKELALATGRSDAWVYQYLALQRLHPELQKLIGPPTPEDMRLGFFVGYTISKAPEDKQLEIVEQARPVLAENFKKGLTLVAKLARKAVIDSGEKVRGRSPHEHAEKIVLLVRRMVKDVDAVLDEKEKDVRHLFLRRPIDELEGLIKHLKEVGGELTALLRTLEAVHKSRMDAIFEHSTGPRLSVVK